MIPFAEKLYYCSFPKKLTQTVKTRMEPPQK